MSASVPPEVQRAIAALYDMQKLAITAVENGLGGPLTPKSTKELCYWLICAFDLGRDLGREECPALVVSEE